VPDPITNEITLTVTANLPGYEPLDVSATVTLTPLAPEPPEPTPPPDDDTAPLCVRIDYLGASYVFDEVLGVDLGDYHEAGGHFVQRCVLCTLPDLGGVRVLFRRDRGAVQRDEVVFELGGLWDTVPANMEAYTATIFRGQTTLAVVQAPEHYWHSRWRWQSAPRPIIYPPDSCATSLPAYSEALFGSAIPLSNARTYAGPMDLAGLTAYIPSTGERDEIGLFTEAQAEFLCQGTDVSWSSVMAQLEASGTLTWHFRDDRTNAPLDWTQYPNATMYGTTGGDPQIENPASPITLDPAHEPALAYLPFLLTGDPYALEEMQFAAVYDVVCLSPGARANFSLGNAIRAVAWTLRGLARAATVTPDTVPSWLLPRALFKRRLDDQRQWFMDRYVSSDAPPFCNLNLMSDAKGAPVAPPIPADSYVSVWMEDYLTSVLAHVVQLGHEDWRPILEWKALDVMSRTNGTSGWVRAVPTLYTLVVKASSDAPYADHWGVAWDLNEHFQPEAVDCNDPDVMPERVDLTYPSYALGALALAARAGVPQAQACYDWLLQQMQANTDGNSYCRRKWAMASPAGY
jgi:hypothetical protein